MYLSQYFLSNVIQIVGVLLWKDIVNYLKTVKEKNS